MAIYHTNRIDPNLKPENIKKGVSIFGVNGKLDGNTIKKAFFWRDYGGFTFNLTLRNHETCWIEGKAYRKLHRNNNEILFKRISAEDETKKYPYIINNSYDGFLVGDYNYSFKTEGNNIKILKFNHTQPSMQPEVVFTFRKGEMQKKIKYNGNYIFVYKNGDTYDGKIGIVVAKEDGSKFDYIEYNIGTLSNTDTRTYSLYGDILDITHRQNKFVNVNLKTKVVSIMDYASFSHIYRSPFIRISEDVVLSTNATNDALYNITYKDNLFVIKHLLDFDINDDTIAYKEESGYVRHYAKITFYGL